MFINNSGETYEIVAEGSFEDITIHHAPLYTCPLATIIDNPKTMFGILLK